MKHLILVLATISSVAAVCHELKMTKYKDKDCTTMLDTQDAELTLPPQNGCSELSEADII